MDDKNILKDHEIATYYNKHGVLGELEEEDVDISLKKRLKEDILSGNRKQRLKNISIKIDLYQNIAIKKIARMKSNPYQTLIRHWLSQYIKKELNL